MSLGTAIRKSQLFSKFYSDIMHKWREREKNVRPNFLFSPLFADRAEFRGSRISQLYFGSAKMAEKRVVKIVPKSICHRYQQSIVGFISLAAVIA